MLDAEENRLDIDVGADEREAASGFSLEPAYERGYGALFLGASCRHPTGPISTFSAISMARSRPCSAAAMSGWVISSRLRRLLPTAEPRN